MTVRMLIGDVRDKLRELADESVHCVVTSPPYFGLRDYGVAGQIGLEPTPAEFVAVMVEVFREVRRVLRKDGTLWMNLGDSYWNGGGIKRDGCHGFVDGGKRKLEAAKGSLLQSKCTDDEWSLKPKDLLGMPWRVAFALQADGWCLRQDIIWAKPNPMPESVTDRCTKAHEYLFLLSKSARYHYDAEAIAEEAEYGYSPTPMMFDGVGDAKSAPARKIGAVQKGDGGTRNRRSVWTVATEPFKEAHFATFPPALIEPCILAGCPKDCCAKCDAPVVRMAEDSAEYAAFKDVERARKGGGMRSSELETMGLTAGTSNKSVSRSTVTTGWSPSCSCNAGTVRGTVLDPFGGAGTTGLVADRLQRNAVLIELNPDYAEMARQRIEGECPMFASVAAG